MRYQTKDNGTKEDSWNGRMRINVKGQVNESTYVNGKMAYDMDFKDDSKDKGVYMQQLFVNHNFGKDVAVRLGRQPIAFGNQGGWLYNGLEGYDGAQIAYNNGKLALTTGFGQLNASDDADWKSKDAYFARGAYDFGFAKLGADYIAQKDGSKDEIYGVNLNIPVQQFNVLGEYWNNTTASDYDTAWNAGLSYGKADWKKAGTWDLTVAYNDVDTNVYFGGSGLNTDILKALKKAKNLTYWNALANVTLQKNVQLHAEYAFAGDAEVGADPEDAWAVSLNYKF